MTRDQIAAWAKKSGLPVSWISDDGILSWADLERFAKLVAAAARAEPLTIERLRDALVASRIVDPAAVEEPEEYDDGLMLHRIEALHRRLT